MKRERFKEAVENLRSSDSLRYDEGYHTLQGKLLTQHLDELIELATNEVDPVIRGRFVELLGESDDPVVLPILARELCSDHAEVRYWALRALDGLGTADASRLADAHRADHPEDAP